MAKKLGRDYRIWIESAGGGFNLIKGQQDLSVDRGNGSIDTTTKDNYPYSTSAPGFKTLTISASFEPDLPDATGYTRLEALANSTTTASFTIQIRKGGNTGVDPGDVVFEALVNSTGLSTSFGMNDAVTSSTSFSLAEAPTVDTLA